MAYAVFTMFLATMPVPRLSGHASLWRSRSIGLPAYFGNHLSTTARNPRSSWRSRNCWMTGSIPAIVMASEDAGLLVREGSISARMTETGFVSAYPRRSSDQAPRPMSDVFAKLTWRFCGAPDWKSPMDASSSRETGTTPSPAASATNLIMPTRSWTAYGSAAPSATNLDRNTSRLFVRFAWNAMAWRSEVNAATTGASDPNSPASTWAYVSNRPVRDALTAAGALPPRRDSRSCTTVNAASSRSAAARSSDAGRPAHLANCAVMASDESVPGR